MFLSYLPLLQAAACRCSSPSQELHHSSGSHKSKSPASRKDTEPRLPSPCRQQHFCPLWKLFKRQGWVCKDFLLPNDRCGALLNGWSCLPPGTQLQGELGFIFMPLPRAPWPTLAGSLYSLHDLGLLFWRSLTPSMSFTRSVQTTPWRWVQLLLQWL